jgi:Protein of unknown function (DUF3309)
VNSADPHAFRVVPSVQAVRNLCARPASVILILLLIGALPTWPYSSGWGYYPGGVPGIILIIVIILWGTLASPGMRPVSAKGRSEGGGVPFHSLN